MNEFWLRVMRFFVDFLEVTVFAAGLIIFVWTVYCLEEIFR